jgi:hypothetical protein
MTPNVVGFARSVPGLRSTTEFVTLFNSPRSSNRTLSAEDFEQCEVGAVLRWAPQPPVAERLRRDTAVARERHERGRIEVRIERQPGDGIDSISNSTFTDPPSTGLRMGIGRARRSLIVSGSPLVHG